MHVTRKNEKSVMSARRIVDNCILLSPEAYVSCADLFIAGKTKQMPLGHDAVCNTRVIYIK